MYHYSIESLFSVIQKKINMKNIIVFFFLLSGVTLLAQDEITIIDIDGNEIHTCKKGAVTGYIFDGFLPMSIPDPDGLKC